MFVLENHVNLPPIAEFIALVRATDEDADYRLPLIERVAPVLYETTATSDADRRLLAEKIERWRYQRLNKYAPSLSPGEQKLVDLLDLAANKILQGLPRPPKAPRAAIHPSESPAGEVDPDPDSAGSVAFEAVLNHRISLKEIAREAAVVTSRHFGSISADATLPAARVAEPEDLHPATRWRMRLYAPLYLSNHCVNHCLYCAFRFPNTMDRVHLGLDQVIAEAEVLRSQGHEHLLIVAGDFPKLTATDYLVTIIRELVTREFAVSVEVAAQSTVSYWKMMSAGASGVTLYQETYQEEIYSKLHPRGPKMWFDWRLEAPERAAEAGIKRLGLGILLGLADPVVDIRSLIRHGQYLLRRFPEVKLAFSLPRIHEAPAGFKPGVTVDDETMTRLYCLLRFSFPTADLVLSTREAPELRDQLARTCITQMSAGSCTAPGGYTAMQKDSHGRQQFPVFDNRTTLQVTETLAQSGFELNWGVDDRPVEFSTEEIGQAV